MVRRTLWLFFFSVASCEPGIITQPEPTSDVEAGVVVLEGEELQVELASSPARMTSEPFVRLGFVWDGDRPTSLEVSTSPDGVDWSPFVTPVVHHVELEHAGSFVGQV